MLEEIKSPTNNAQIVKTTQKNTPSGKRYGRRSALNEENNAEN
jgi:hypothetical protein